MLAYAPMLPYYYYAQNYASIICQGLLTTGNQPGGHQGYVTPLGKNLPFNASPSNCLLRWHFWPYPIAGTHAVMAQWSLNMASGAPKTLGPGILGASSPNINLSTKMASEAISEHLIFLGGACPQTPLVHACLHMYHHRCSPPPLNHKYLPPPLLITLS